MLLWHVTASKKIDGNAWKLLPWNVGALLAAWSHLKISGDKRYNLPPGLKENYIYGGIESKSLIEIEKEYNVHIDRSQFQTNKFSVR
jgi:hypothetical protein